MNKSRKSGFNIIKFLTNIAIVLILFFTINFIYTDYFYTTENFEDKLKSNIFVVTSEFASYVQTTNKTEEIYLNISENCSSELCELKRIEEFVYNKINYERTSELYNPDQIIEKEKGDCKHKSILFASILKEKDLETYLVIQEGHSCIMYKRKERSGYNDFNCFDRDIHSIHKLN